jgi:hypothetical protein
MGGFADLSPLPTVRHVAAVGPPETFAVNVAAKLAADAVEIIGRLLWRSRRGKRTHPASAEVVNRDGHPQTLVAAHPGNNNRLAHGLYSKRREIAPEALEIAADLMQLPHVTDSDYRAAVEIAKLELLVDRIDLAIADAPLERRGQVRSLVDQRRRMTTSLERWYVQFGLTPNARAEWAAKLARPSFMEQVEQRRREIAERERDGHE